MGDRKTLDVPFVGGLKQKTALPWLGSEAQQIAQNAIWVEQSAVEKRPGYFSPGAKNITFPFTTPDWGAASITTGAGLIASQMGPVIHDGWYAYAPNAGSNTCDWLSYAPPCVATRKTVGNSPNGVANPTVADWNGQALYVWQDATLAGSYGFQLYYSLVEEATGKILRAGAIGVSGLRARVVITASGQAYVLYESSTTSIGVVYLNLVSGASSGWSASATLPSVSGYSDVGFDIALSSFVNGTTSYFALAYYSTTGADLALAIYASSATYPTLVVGNVVSVTSGTRQAPCVTWDTTTNRMWYGINVQNSTTSIVYGGYATSAWTGSTFTLTPTSGLFALGTNTTATLIQLAVCEMPAAANPQACFVWQWLLTTGVNVVACASCTNIGLGVENPYGWNLQLMSKPFAVASPDASGYKERVYAVVAAGTAQLSQILVECDVNTSSAPLRPAASIAPRLLNAFGAGVVGAYAVSAVANASAGSQWRTAGLISQTQNNPGNYSALGLVFDFASLARGASCQVGNLSYVAGGLPCQFDGARLVESSTLQQCAPTGVAPSTTGGSLTNGQTYSYIIVPEWRDAIGNVCQGQPSAPVTATIPGSTGATGSVVLQMQTLSLTLKTPMLDPTANLYLIPYRTAYTGGAMSVNYYRIPGDNPGAAYVNNIVGGATLSVTDNLSDAALVTHALLPTTGGVLECDSPSSFAAICSHDSRVYGLADDLRTLWISTEQVDGLPCYFNDGSQSEISFLGDLTAVWSQDSNIFVGNATGIAYASGGGPSLTGVQSDLSSWIPIATDVGPTSPTALCVTQIGTVFRSTYGLGLLDRSLSVHSDFGDAVTSYLQTYSQVTSIVEHPTRPEIWVFANAPGGSGIVLMFNYRYSAWSSATIGFDPDFGAAPPIVAADVYGGNVWFLTSLGRLWRECLPASDYLPYFDTVGGASYWVPLSVISAWVKPGGEGLQGPGWVHHFEMTWQPQDWSDVTIQTYVDYQDVATNTWAWSSAAVNANTGGLGVVTAVDLRPNPSGCTAMAFVFFDAQPAGSPTYTTGQGPRLLGVSCEIEALGGLTRVGAAQKG